MKLIKTFRRGLKRALLRTVVRRRLPLSLSRGRLPWEDNVRTLYQWNNNSDEVLCNLSCDDLCPKYYDQDARDYGGRSGYGTAAVFAGVLEAFPAIAATMFTIPDCKLRVKGRLAGPRPDYDISRPEFAAWRDFYAGLAVKFNLEFAVHGLHHWQRENPFFGRQTEFAFKRSSEVLTAVKTAIQVFRAVGWDPTGFRQPGWDLPEDLATFRVLRQCGIRYVASSSRDGGLNAGRPRVSVTHPCVVEGILNLPQNIELDWPEEQIISEVAAIASVGGLVSFKCHFVDRGDTNSLSKSNAQKLLKVLDKLHLTYRKRLRFATLREISELCRIHCDDSALNGVCLKP